jgi:hypothetical protein
MFARKSTLRKNHRELVRQSVAANRTNAFAAQATLFVSQDRDDARVHAQESFAAQQGSLAPRPARTF